MLLGGMNAISFINGSQESLADVVSVNWKGPIETLAKKFELTMSKQAYGHDTLVVRHWTLPTSHPPLG